MTQAAVSSWISYASTGVIEAYGYPFRIDAASELQVYVDGVLYTDYVITGVGSASGGTITPNSALATGSLVFLRRVTPQTQATDYILNDPFGAESHEAALDKLTRLVQELSEVLSRTPSFAVTLANSLRNLILPAPQALKLLGFDALGTGWALYDSAIVTITVDATNNIAYGKSSQSVTASAGAAVLTASGLIPAGCQCLGVLYHCTTDFGTGQGLASLSLGDAVIMDRWGSGLGRTAGTQTNLGTFSAGWVSAPTAIDVLLSSQPGLYDAAGAAILTSLWVTGQPD